MFPTGVGMNRKTGTITDYTYDVPHRRGDEPIKKAYAKNPYECSPQAWG